MWGAAELTLSHQGQVMGTPASMPPEQARGDVHAVDARSDLFSLGSVLYEALTGRPPFSGTNVMAVLAKILILVFIILFIQKRPRGLFALKGRAVEQ